MSAATVSAQAAKERPSAPMARLVKTWAESVVRYPEAGWATVLLAFGCSLVVAWSIEIARWVPEIPHFLIAVGSGGALGLLVAQTRRFVILPHVAVVALGAGQSLAHTLLTVSGSSVEGRVLTGTHRVMFWAQALFEGGASTDKLAFVLMLTFAVWLLSYLTVFLVLRFRSVWALLPSGFALFSNLTYLPPRALSWLLLYLLAAGLLLVRLVYLERARAWRASGAAPTRWLALHTLHAGLWFALMIFVITTFVPALHTGPASIRNAWAAMRSPLGDMESTFSRIFASLPARRSLSLYGFGSELPFRGNISLTDDVVMLVQSEAPLYWRARTYDAYHRWGWGNGPLVERKLASLQDVGGALPPCEECVRGYTVEVRTPTTTVYTAGVPLRTSLAVEARYLAAEGPATDRVVKLESRRAMQPHYRYTVQVSVPRVTGDALQREPAVYPPWIESRYLSLPEGFSPRVRDLALQITRDAKTPYEKAVRIRDHLRQYTYSQEIEAAPPGADAIEHFLFVQKAGYSDYFGSSMVVLLRASGVPSRLAVGYITGDLDGETSSWVVRESDAHAWAEAYFPISGWVPFEPTPSQPTAVPGGPIDLVASARPLGLAGTASGDLHGFFWEDENAFQTGGFDPLGIDPLEGQRLDLSRPIAVARTVLLAAAGIAVLLLLALMALVWWRGLSRPRTAAQAYTQMARLGSLAGLRLRNGETPQEYAARLSDAAPAADGALLSIAETYGRATYGPKGAAHDSLLDGQTWGTASRRLLGLTVRRITGGHERTNGRLRRLGYES